jgi:type VI secretion system protein ImpG
MADELLSYYEKELAFIRQMGSEFAKEHPKIAGRLGINDDIVEDPHVSRLIESFAYLNARIQHKLDDDFPELSDALLNVLFPHYLRPIPSISIVQFTPETEQLESSYTIPKQTLLQTDQFQGESCIFSTIYPTVMHPLELTTASLHGLPLSTPGSSRIRGANSVLKLSFSAFSEQIDLTNLKPGSLRFYLKGQSQHINPLYKMLLNDCVNVVLSRSDTDLSPIFMGNDVINSVGFGNEDGLLPYPPASFTGYRLLTEFFIFPEKFMFLEISGLDKFIPEDIGNTLDLYIYLKTADVELEHNISKDTFALGCTPVVNLFSHKTDPIKLEHTRHEYQVIPEARRPTGYEIYSIDKVSASTPSGDIEEYHPMFGLNHDNQNSVTSTYWYASRRNAKLGIYERDEGTDMYLSLVDLDFNPNLPEERTLNIDATCSNRDQPTKLPFSADQPKLQCTNAAPPCSKIRFLIRPSAVVRPPLRNQARWRLISHLNLNFLSLTGRDDATTALKEILRLYDFKESSVTRALVDSITSVKTRPISAPLNIDGHTTMCRGMEVEIEIDDYQLAGSSVYLYATILEHFFALYCSINSFTRVLVRIKSQEGYLKQCPPRAGEKILL